MTVFMPVYNGEKFVSEAIESTLNQSFRSFQFLIIDDGSIDKTEEIIRSYADERILFVKHSRNWGIPATRNDGLARSVGKYIALMDADDIASPYRLEKQIDFLERNPAIGVCGTWYKKIHGSIETETRFPTDHSQILFWLLFDNTFGQNTIVLRKSIIEKYGLRYDESLPFAEDYDFWVRCSLYTKIANLPEALVWYRFHDDNSSCRYRTEMKHCADIVRRRHLLRMGVFPEERVGAIHSKFIDPIAVFSPEELEDLVIHLSSLIRACDHNGCPPDLVRSELGRRYYSILGSLADHGISIWTHLMRSAMRKHVPLVYALKLLVRCLVKRPIIRQVCADRTPN